MKTVWLTALAKDEAAVSSLVAKLKGYGIEVRGHFWEDDLEKMAWLGVREELARPDGAAWLILTGTDGLSAASVRLGLSLLALSVRAKRAVLPTVFLLPAGVEAPAPGSLPTPLADAESMSLADPALAAKLVARVHTSVPPRAAVPYRLDFLGNPQIGLWAEIGPSAARWEGAMLGVAAGAEILFHGVGPKGALPDRAVLEYPVKGMTLAIGGREFTAWGVKNVIDTESSYYVKFKGSPGALLFGEFPEGEDPEAFVINLS
jgi:hypothetical protein